MHKFCAWSGIVCLVLMVAGFIGLARFFPPPSPALTTAETTRFILDHTTTIRWGMVVTMAAAVFLGVLAVEIAVQMRRIEGRFPALAMIEFGFGMLFVLEFLYLLFFWQTATFRADRDPKLVELLNDMAWIPFVGLTGTAAAQVAAFGVAILIDRRPTPVFPRWLGYVNLWTAMIFCAGTFNVFFKRGPLAWNGLLAWWLPVVVFGVWLVLVSVYLIRAVQSHLAEVGAEENVEKNVATGSRARDRGTPTHAELAAQIAQLQAQVGELRDKAASTTH
ncbi:hypothetical protein Mkiyose1665_03070 [Mycobacterium kiyosense]|nr:hypothetical protein SRL2020226_03010 [Mycobacterium kiyosense]GLB99754.1 hypothetical protein SRL2020400_03460 [Mycobacterium kiyosense]GLC07174.1 hypothetical protein SRL2020411_18200 [Mycobacterium kiyosense]GLC99168.1 hypothetical protein Mkiyose1088_10350 [Mycobacterium kiyosense]GLD17361.1 hypothetical protein Mkiyose1385_14600 [Mycobacterium kiyosense]